MASLSSESKDKIIVGERILTTPAFSITLEEKAFVPTSIALDRRPTNVVADFVARSQELDIITKRLDSGLKISPDESKNFFIELSNFHCKSAKSICHFLHSDEVSGLSDQQAAALLESHGPNIIPQSKEIPMFVKFLLCFISGFSLLLWFACLFAFLSWEPFGAPPSNVYNLALAIVLIIVILVSGMFTFYQELQTSNVLESFKTLVPQDCVVCRAGRQLVTSTLNLVVGDVILLELGSRVPADVRVLSSAGLKIDKSLLTGENEPMKLTAFPVDASIPMLQATNIAFMGCNIVEGQGTGIVIAAGRDTQLAKIVSRLSEVSSRLSTLQIEVNRFVLIITTFAVITMSVLMIYWAAYLDKYHNSFMSLSLAIANSIGALVAFVPEGLPLALSMGLTLIAKRLCNRYHVLVKYLPTVETLGCMSYIASDKTGTLTQNKMTVTRVVVGEQVTEATQISSTVDEALSPEVKSQLLRCAVLCNQSKLDASAGRRVAVGSNGIDKALLNYAEKLEAVDGVLATSEIKLIVPFNSATKLTTVVVQSLTTHTFTVIVKGAPEYVLDLCRSYLDSTGEVLSMSNETADNIQANIRRIADTGERIIAIAQRVLHLPSDYTFTASPVNNFPTDGLTLVACVSVSDPPRAGVLEAVQRLRTAGIRIAMVTGDAPSTALAIARQVGIVTCNNNASSVTHFRTLRGSVTTTSAESNVWLDVEAAGRQNDKEKAIVVEGRDLLAVTEADWDLIFHYDEQVFARVTPEQKLLIVKESQRRGFIVGVTGDGVNDSPALKRADVGIAMNSGSDVARDAAAIVLLNDDFNAIVHGVEEGRLIFSNLRKVIAYQIAAGCYSELLPVLATFFLGMPQPLSSFLMIIISTMTDVFAGVALTTEPPETSIMLEPPRNTKTSRLVDFRLIGYSYLFYGNLASFGAFFNFFHYMANRGGVSVPTPIPSDDDGSRAFPSGYTYQQIFFAWNWGANSGNLGSDENNAGAVASSIFFVALLVSQMGHLLSVRRKTPYLYEAIMNPSNERSGSVWTRIWNQLQESPPRYQLVLAIILSALTANFFNEIPAIQVTCGTGSVPALYWGLAFGWSALWFVVAEVRKWLVALYPNSWVAKTAW